jgi:outer membrane cobalamin receptor
MNSQNFRRASLIALAVSAALGSGVAWSQDAGPQQQAQGSGDSEELGVITVTGSRTITEVVKSPTPITSVDIAELAVTTPSDTADALNKLPNIMGGRTPRTQGNGSTNNGGNTLSLRNFGPQRTLVLMNGHRIAPSNQDGSVNIDVLPQMLVKKVDIVTGGASAIYGSDAVAGVVNYVLDNEFTGLNVKADYGMSKYSDGDQYHQADRLADAFAEAQRFLHCLEQSPAHQQRQRQRSRRTQRISKQQQGGAGTCTA